MVVVVFGLPGSGKSYFALKLAQQIGADYLNTDIIRKTLLTSRTYSDDEKFMIYMAMLDQVKQLLRKGKQVVVDGTFYKKVIRQKFISEIPPEKKVIFIEIIAEENIVMQRLLQRRPDSDADFEIYRKVKALWEPLTDAHLLLYSTNNNINIMLQQAQQHLLHQNNNGTN